MTSNPEPKYVLDVRTSLDDVADLVPEWDALAERLGAGPFALPTVALAWWRHLGKGQLALAVVRTRAGRTVAVAPLHERRLGGQDVLRWLGHGLGTVGEVLVEPGHEAAVDVLWDGLARGRRVLQLVECRHGGGGLLSLRRSARWDLTVTLEDRCPTVDVSGVASVDELLSTRRNLRHTLSRADRAVARLDLVHAVEAITDRDRFDEVLDEVTDVYTEAETARPRQHLLAPPWRDFTVAAFREAAERKQLAVFAGRLGERLVSFDAAFRAGACLSDWVGRFRPGVADLSPGHLLLRGIVEWALTNGVATVDLMVGDDPYKQRWATGGYDTLAVVAAAPGRLALARSTLRAYEAAHTLRRRARRG